MSRNGNGRLSYLPVSTTWTRQKPLDLMGVIGWWVILPLGAFGAAYIVTRIVEGLL